MMKILIVILISTISCFVLCARATDEEETVEHFVEHFRKVFPFLNDSQVQDHQIRYVQLPSGNYTGQLNEIEERDGWGEMLWANGTLYGPNDIFYYSAGDKYFGQWKNNQQEGVVAEDVVVVVKA